jgi:hypothetical protein
VPEGKGQGPPACQKEWKKCEEEMNNHIDVMWICVSVYIWCSAVMLFICTIVLSRQSARKGLSAKYEPVKQTARFWVGQSKQEYTWGKRTSKRHSLTLDRGHEGRIHELLQDDGRSSMYRTIIV